MSTHEEAGAAFGEAPFFEAEMLRGDLADAFKRHVEDTALHIPDDFAEPAEVILAGAYQVEGDEYAELSIHQRVDATGPSYLIQYRYGQDRPVYVITGADARSVWLGMPDIPSETLRTLRDIMRPGIVTWDPQAAQRLADERPAENPYAALSYYAGAV